MLTTLGRVNAILAMKVTHKKGRTQDAWSLYCCFIL